MRLDLDRLRSDLTQHAEAVAIALLGKPATRSRGELRYGRKRKPRNRPGGQAGRAVARS